MNHNTKELVNQKDLIKLEIGEYYYITGDKSGTTLKIRLVSFIENQMVVYKYPNINNRKLSKQGPVWVYLVRPKSMIIKKIMMAKHGGQIYG